MRSRPFLCIVWALLVGLLALGPTIGPVAHAQARADQPWSLGTPGGTTALGAPTTSLFSNPAHLTAGSPGSEIELRVFDVSASVGGGLLQFNHYEETFGDQAGTLTNAEEADVLDEWFGGEERGVATDAEVVPFALTYQPRNRSWAIGGGVRARVRSEAKMDRGLLDLLAVGADSNRTVPLGGGQRTLSTVDLTGAFSYQFDTLPLSIGVAPRFIVGTQYADATLDSEVTIRDSVWTHRFDWTARAAGGVSRAVYDEVSVFRADPLGNISGLGGTDVAGIGAGLDLGATYALRPNFFVSVSLTDLGVLRWTRDAQTISDDDTFRFDGVELDVDRLQNEFDGDVGAYMEHQADSLARAVYESVDRERASFSTGLPTTLHVGSTWSRDRFTVSGGASVGLQGTAGAVRTAPTAHLGGEYRLGPVPIRLGIRMGGAQAVTLAGGIGVHAGGYRLDLGVSATPSTSTAGGGGHYAVGLSLATVRF